MLIGLDCAGVRTIVARDLLLSAVFAAERL